MGEAKPDITARALEMASDFEAIDSTMTRDPWKAGGTRTGLVYGDVTRATAGVADCPRQDDADGIAYLRNAAPDVAAVLRELVAEVERMRSALSGQMKVRVGDVVTVVRCPHLPETEGRGGTVTEIDPYDYVLPFGVEVDGIGFRWCAAVSKGTP